MTRDVLIIVLSIIALTIIFVVIILFVSMNYTSFKNKIINRKCDELYKKDLLKQNNEFSYMVVNPELKNGFVDVNSYIGYARTNKDAKKVSFNQYYFIETDQEKRAVFIHKPFRSRRLLTSPSRSSYNTPRVFAAFSAFSSPSPPPWRYRR